MPDRLFVAHEEARTGERGDEVGERAGLLARVGEGVVGLVELGPDVAFGDRDRIAEHCDHHRAAEQVDDRGAEPVQLRALAAPDGAMPVPPGDECGERGAVARLEMRPELVVLEDDVVELVAEVETGRLQDAGHHARARACHSRHDDGARQRRPHGGSCPENKHAVIASIRAPDVVHNGIVFYDGSDWESFLSGSGPRPQGAVHIAGIEWREDRLCVRGGYLPGGSATGRIRLEGVGVTPAGHDPGRRERHVSVPPRSPARSSVRRGGNCARAASRSSTETARSPPFPFSAKPPACPPRSLAGGRPASASRSAPTRQSGLPNSRARSIGFKR